MLSLYSKTKLTEDTQNKNENSIPKLGQENLERQKENQRIPRNKRLKEDTAYKAVLWQALCSR
jgi:DNA polymerase III psi subunit